MTPRDDRISTSIYYKDTDSHSYLNFGSSHPSKCKSSRPHSQFLRLQQICSEDDVFQSEATTMQAFFTARGYPHDLMTRARLRAEERQRADLLVTTPGWNCTAADRSSLAITYHPKNIAVCNILLRNYTILWDDDSTKITFDKPALKACRRAKNLKDLLVHSSLQQVLQRQIGTFPCNRRDCRTCPFINSSDRITTTQGQIKISGFFTCISSKLICCISRRKCPGVVYIWETGRRLGDRFREHRLDVIKKKVAPPVPAHFAGMDHQLEDMQVAVIRAGLPEQDKRRREEMRFIHNFGTLLPGGLNQDFCFTWLARTHTRLFLRAHWFSNFPLWRTPIRQHCRNVRVLFAIISV